MDEKGIRCRNCIGSRMAGTFGLAACVATLALSHLAATEEKTAAQLRDEATVDYRAGHYKEACEKFKLATDLAPKNGAIWADLGLCLQKQGRKQQALEADHRALVHGDPRTRRNVYFNLSRLETRVDLPPVDKCGPLAAAPGCKESLNACTFRWMQNGSHGGIEGLGVRIGRTPEAAKAGESECARETVPAIPRGLELHEPWGDNECLSDILLEADEWTGGIVENDYEWNCERSDAVRDEAIVCLTRTPGCSDSMRPCELNNSECFREACARQTRSPSAEVKKEQKRLLEAFRAAQRAQERYLKEQAIKITCHVVAANACAGVVGVTCQDGTIDEVLLPREE